MKYLINDSVIVVVIDGKPSNITKTSGYYDRALSAIRAKNENALRAIVDALAAVRVACVKETDIEVRGNGVYFRGDIVHNAVANKIVSFVRKGLPVTSLLNFLRRLLKNPSARSVEQFYTFVEKHNITIDDEGFVYMWKAVRSDFADKHTGKVSNRPGAKIAVERNKVSDDANAACHFGLHAGAFEYVRSFGSGGDRFVLVKIDPENVVSVPHDASAQKVRVCAYEVVREVSREDVREFQDTIGEQFRR